MAINVQINDISACITMPGVFGFDMHNKFKGAYTPLLGNAAVREIEVEFRRMSCFDSSLLDMLTQLHERAKKVNKQITLLNPSSLVLKIFCAANCSTFNIKHTPFPEIKNRRSLGERRDPYIPCR